MPVTSTEHVVRTPRPAALKERGLRRWISRLRNASRRGYHLCYQYFNPRVPSTPVFVMGNHSSGTTITMRVFDLCRDARSYSNYSRRAYVDGRIAPPETLRRILRSSRAAITVFKPLRDVPRLSRLLELYPSLKVVWLLRRPSDCVNSCVKRWTGMREILSKIIEDPAAAGWHGDGVLDVQREMLRQHFDPQMSPQMAYALWWCLRNSFFFESGLDRCDRVNVFRYEQMVRQPDEEFRRMFEFLEIPYDPWVTREIFDSSVGRYPPPELAPGVQAWCDSLSGRFMQYLRDRGVCAADDQPASALVGARP
jgi:hypothetical protein